jgi:hypothetical protein
MLALANTGQGIGAANDQRACDFNDVLISVIRGK